MAALISQAFMLLLSLLFTLTLAQAPQDPLRDFCRRYGHQTTIIDRKLYIDGGWLYANPIEENPVPTINQGLLYSDLDVLSDNMPKQYANLSKNSTVPDVSGGILWPDEVNKVFWLYGGEYSTAPSTFQLWGYDTILNQWNLSSASVSSTTAIKRVAYGAGTTVGGKGYYYGGYLNSLTNPLWTGPALATSNLVVLDMDANTLSNSTGPDSIGRAEGVMVSIPASAAGLLVYFGGVMFPYDNSTEVPMSMTDIMIYDVGDDKWYTQTATGDIPANRRKFCAGATWADDQSSYNIYLYGGFGFGENTTGFDDVYILSLPTFEWIKWYPEAPGASAPHGLLSCNVIDKGQMMVMGGNFTNSSSCDVPTIGAQHNLNLGQVNPTNAKWYQYLPNITDYSVPPAILSVTGGSSDGGADNQSPADGWSDAALSVYFGQKAQFEARTPTRYIPPPTTTATPLPPSGPGPQRTNIGAIAGGVVAGVAALLIIAGAIWFCLRKRKSTQADNTTSQPKQTGGVVELTGDSYPEKKEAMVTTSPTSPVYSPMQAQSPYVTPPPFPQGHPMSYQHSGQPPQSYFGVQQPGYGFPQYPQGTGSPQPMMYPQQPFQPQPIVSRSPPPQEMPTSFTSGVHHVAYQHVPQNAREVEGSTTSGSQGHSWSDRHSRVT